jgi:hypothetical protein
MEKVAEVLIPITMFAMTLGIVYVTVSARHRERMAMIERGVDTSIFKRQRNHDNNLKWGIIVLMVAIGLVVGNAVSKASLVDEELAGAAFPLMFGGAGMLIYYFLRKPKYDAMESKDSSSNPPAAL